MAEAGASTGLSWQEVSRYLNEMTAVLSLRDDKDAEAIMSLASAKQALQSIFGASEANGKRAIAGEGQSQPLPARYAPGGRSTPRIDTHYRGLCFLWCRATASCA